MSRTRCIKAASIVVILVCLGVASRTLLAQGNPPNRFYGSLTLDGSPAPAGTRVRAFIADKDCTPQREPFQAPVGQYAVEVAHANQIPGCGTDGAQISFRVNDRATVPLGTFQTGQFTRLDLTITGAGAPAATATVAAAPAAATPAPTAAPPPSAGRFTTAWLNLSPDASRCVPPGSDARCDEVRQRLWIGDQTAWTAEMARLGRPAPTPDEVFILTYEFRIGAADPAAITSLAQGLGWPKVYVTAVKFRGAAAGEADEYVEITNVGGASQEMTGWRAFSVQSATDFFFSDGSVLEPGARCRFYTGAAQPDSCPGSFNVATQGVWDDTAGSAELWYDPLALLADKTRYAAEPSAQPPPPNLVGTTNAPVG